MGKQYWQGNDMYRAVCLCVMAVIGTEGCYAEEYLPLSAPDWTEVCRSRRQGYDLLFSAGGGREAGLLAELPPLRYSFGKIFFAVEEIAAILIADAERGKVEYITNDGRCYSGVIEDKELSFTGDGGETRLYPLKQLAGVLHQTSDSWSSTVEEPLFALDCSDGSRLYVHLANEVTEWSDGWQKYLVARDELESFSLSEGLSVFKGKLVRHLELMHLEDPFLSIVEPRTKVCVKLPREQVIALSRYHIENQSVAVKKLMDVLPSGEGFSLRPGLSASAASHQFFVKACSKVVGLVPLYESISEGIGAVALARTSLRGAEHAENEITVEQLAIEEAFRSGPEPLLHLTDDFGVPNDIDFLEETTLHAAAGNSSKFDGRSNLEDLENIDLDADWIDEDEDDEDDDAVIFASNMEVEVEDDDEDEGFFEGEYYVGKEEGLNNELILGAAASCGERANAHVASMSGASQTVGVLSEEMAFIGKSYLPYSADHVQSQQQIADGYHRKGTLLPTAGIPLIIAEALAFYIDKAEVTNSEYHAFVKATGSPAPCHWKGGAIPSGEEDRAVVNVGYSEATAYADWRGKRLPTEEEWLRARDLGSISEDETIREWVYHGREAAGVGSEALFALDPRENGSSDIGFRCAKDAR